MADIKSPEERSRNMSAIRSRNTKPELYLRKLLFAEGLRYRTNVKKLPGCPDMYFARYRTAVFVHGCFWHQHEGCRYAYMHICQKAEWSSGRRNLRQTSDGMKMFGMNWLLRESVN